MPKRKQAAVKTAPLSTQIAKGLREGALIGLLALTVYLVMALITYNPTDPGWSYVGQTTEVDNAAGRTGAWLADVLLSLLGYIAYIFPMMLLYRAVLIFRDREKPAAWSWPMFSIRVSGLILILLAGTSLLTLHYGYNITGVPNNASAGGLLGQEISKLALLAFNPLGSTLILLAAMLFGMTVFMEISWLKVMDFVGKSILDGGNLLIEKSSAAWQQWWERQRAGREIKRVKEERQEAVKAQTKLHADRKPPTIKKAIKKVEPSVRVYKEKQGNLFGGKATGTLPAISLLDEADKNKKKGYSKEALEAVAKLLELKLKDFSIVAEVVAIQPGPVITRFEIQPAAGVKASRISGLAKDLARSLAVISVRVVEVIPGKSVVGIEIPNENRDIVMMNEVLASSEFDDASSPLSLALGKDISGIPVVVDLAKMPHLLVAGTTGSGKSVGINVMLLSLLFKASPDQVRLIMVDPKMLELSVYEGIPHLLTPVVTDMKEAANALRWCVGEMERRYRLMAALGVRNIAGYNRKVADAAKAKNPIPDPLWRPEEGWDDIIEAPLLEELPFIVVVIDEFADMMMVVGKKVEELIARIAQKARAAGIHLVLATQRPSVDVITGLIKANVPTRISFQVSSKTDSRTILDQGGGEQLLGHGDMLYLPPGSGVPVRVHGAFVSDDEVHRVVADWKQRGEPNYLDEVLEGNIEAGGTFTAGLDNASNGSAEDQDPLYDEAVVIVTESRRASISSVQRKLKIGYNRAARIIESMELAGIVTEMGSNGNREVLAPPPPKM